MRLIPICVWVVGFVGLLTSGCDLSYPSRYRAGTKLYDKQTHAYYGQVVTYDSTHSFTNGLRVPSVEIDLAPDAKSKEAPTRVWAACDVIGMSYTTDASPTPAAP